MTERIKQMVGRNYKPTLIGMGYAHAFYRELLRLNEICHRIGLPGFEYTPEA